MGALFMLVFVMIILIPVIISSRAKTAPVRQYLSLESGGVRGRALVLASMQMSWGVTLGMRRFTRRQMTLEIELPGQAPYDITDQFLVPRGIVEPIPGSSLEVAVGGPSGSQVAILGPGGFTGPWLNFGPPQPF
jgi:hypothetical protein